MERKSYPIFEVTGSWINKEEENAEKSVKRLKIQFWLKKNTVEGLLKVNISFRMGIWGTYITGLVEVWIRNRDWSQ